MGIKISDLLTKEQKVAKKWIEKKKEDFTMNQLLKKAKEAEAKKKYREAIDAYFKFLEIKLKVIKERPEKTLKEYFGLIPYYVKIAESYRKTKHLRPEDRKIDMEKSAKYYEKAATMCIEQKNYKDAHSYYEEASKSYQEIEEYDNAAMCYVKIAEMYINTKSFLMASSSYVKAAELYDKGNSFEKSAKAYENAAKLNIKIKNFRDAIINYENAGNSYQKLRDYLKGIKFYLEATEIASELEHYQKVAELYGKIGQAYEKLKDYKTGIHYYLKSVELGDDEIKKSSYTGIGRCYENLKLYKESIEYYKKAAEISLNLKKNLDAALLYRDIARCYKSLNDEKSAADFYFQYAEFYSLEDEEEGIKGYEAASDLYLKVAEKFLKKKKNLENAIKTYEKVADCYEKSHQYEKAAEIFHKIAKLESERDNYDKVIKNYLESARLYEKSGNLEKAALSYRRAEDYRKAIKFYIEYASKEQKKRRLFYAGNGYKNAAECYEKIKDIEKAKSYYAKAIHTYLKHIENLKYVELKKITEENEGNSYRKIAESYILMNEIPNAKKYLENALKYYKENKLTKEETLSEALLSKVNAELSVRQGDYENAYTSLNNSIKIFWELLKDEEFTPEYRTFLERQKKEAEKLLKEISLKPEVSLFMDRRSYTFINTPVIINAFIKNQGNKPVYDLNFLSHLPEELKVLVLPTSIPKLTPEEEIKKAIEILPRKIGEYRIRPLEIYYKDKEGNTYVKPSNNVTLKVVEKPSMDFKDYRFTVASYLEYAETQLKNKNYFHAAEGYRGVAEVYRKFNEDIASKENYEKAIENYLKHSEILLKEKADVVKLHALGDTYKRIGECYEILSILEDSEKYYSKSIEYYEKTKSKVVTQKEKLSLNYQIMVTKAFLAKVQAKFAIQLGDYEKGFSLLENSINLLDEAIKKGDFDKETEEFLEKNLREAKALMESIKYKPNISLELTYSTKAKLNVKHKIEIKVENKWDKPIFDLKFITKLPKEFEISGEIEKIPKLEPKESITLSLFIIPKVIGEYKFKPLDLAYKDEKENNYMKGCEQINIEVT